MGEDQNDLFEKYLGNSLKRALSPLPVRLQDRRYFALQNIPSGNGAFSLRPDMIVETTEGAVVIDTKWKRLKSNGERNLGISQSDVYQMLAYAHAYNANRLVLLYPWDRNLGRPGLLREWNIANTERVVQASCVNIGETNRVAEQLRSLFP